jgi:uncharacterized membrane protein YGL010W
MKSISDWFDAYGVSHQNPTNKAIHWVCVPAIFFSIVVLVAAIPFPVNVHPLMHWGTVALLGVLVFYMRLSVPIALGMGLFSLFCLLGNWALMQATDQPVWMALGIFVLAWIGQFYGHKVEGAKPSFLEDLQFLLIGPAWLMGFVYRRLGISY